MFRLIRFDLISQAINPARGMGCPKINSKIRPRAGTIFSAKEGQDISDLKQSPGTPMTTTSCS